ncbi:MAG: trimeric intracellular cation channel family protein [Gammaproteobacteria bacterium]|nr:trimeric intracellular cation channel family protein [Gammaproteobacteria bacterium]NND59801.1 trimeric intracellular cation channel family protein [Gammaproteobacteria bacterium]
MTSWLLYIPDLVGTFVFAISGAMLGVRRQLDLFGVLVLSFAAASCGGLIRDLIIGAVPPAAFADWRYVAVSCAAGVITFYRYALIERLQNPVQVFDAMGLALFCVAGALKSLNYGLGPVAAVLMGMLTGIGGGIVRDVLVAEVPRVLRSELYAIAALAGAALLVTGKWLGLPDLPLMAAGAGLCFFLRFMAIRHGWKLPVARYDEDS